MGVCSCAVALWGRRAAQRVGVDPSVTSGGSVCHQGIIE